MQKAKLKKIITKILMIAKLYEQFNNNIKSYIIFLKNK